MPDPRALPATPPLDRSSMARTEEAKAPSLVDANTDGELPRRFAGDAPIAADLLLSHPIEATATRGGPCAYAPR